MGRRRKQKGDYMGMKRWQEGEWENWKDEAASGCDFCPTLCSVQCNRVKGIN